MVPAPRPFHRRPPSRLAPPLPSTLPAGAWSQRPAPSTAPPLDPPSRGVVPPALPRPSTLTPSTSFSPVSLPLTRFIEGHGKEGGKGKRLEEEGKTEGEEEKGVVRKDTKKGAWSGRGTWVQGRSGPHPLGV